MARHGIRNEGGRDAESPRFPAASLVLGKRKLVKEYGGAPWQLEAESLEP
jgi:hypothetical protein